MIISLDVLAIGGGVGREGVVKQMLATQCASKRFQRTHVLRKASEARVDTRLRWYYLIVLLLPNIFTLACFLLRSI